MNRTRNLAAAFAAALLLVACGGGGDDPAAPPNVTASGASIVSDDGKATLTVPAGAASAPQRVALAAAPQTPDAGERLDRSRQRLPDRRRRRRARRAGDAEDRDPDDVSAARLAAHRSQAGARRHAQRRSGGGVRTDTSVRPRRRRRRQRSRRPRAARCRRVLLRAPAAGRPVEGARSCRLLRRSRRPERELRDPEPRDGDTGRRLRRRAADRQRRGDRRAGAAGQGHQRRHATACASPRATTRASPRSTSTSGASARASRAQARLADRAAV